jgi:single-strand DNA-binding protein
MNAVNELKLLGHVGNDPELRSTTRGQTVGHFRVATNEEFTKKSTGERKCHTEWHDIEVWGKLSEQCATHLRKGNRVFVNGKIRTRKRTDSDGRVHYNKYVLANMVIFLDKLKPGSQTEVIEPEKQT